MKSTVITQVGCNRPYPKLRINDLRDLIVLFTNPENGTVVKGNSYHPVGRVGTCWASNSFVDFNGSVILENN